MENKKLFVVNPSRNQSLIVELNGSRLLYELSLSGDISQAATEVVYSSEELAKAAFDGMGKDSDVKELLKVFAFCSEFTKQLNTKLYEARKNANSKATAIPTHRVNGGSTYGRYGVSSTTTSRAYPKR